MSDELQDADRFLLFFTFLDPNGPRPDSIDGVIKVFAKIAGWEENRARSAFEVCAVKGWIDQS